MIDLLSPMASMFAGGSGGGGGLSMPSNATSSLSDRSPINVAPVGVNFGAILQPVSQGSPENGGYGADFMSRYSGQLAGRTASDAKTSNLLPWIIAGGASVLALIFLIK